MASGIYKRILLLSEGTEPGMKAARHAVELAEREKASLVIVSVVDTATLKSLLTCHVFLQDEMEEYGQQMEQTAQKQLNYAHTLALKARLDVKTVLLKGAWHAAVLNEQRERKCDLVVMGGFKATMAKRDLIAREKQLILDEIECAVLLVR